MRTPQEKQRLLEEQLISKVLWGTDPQEARAWLSEKHAITGIDADRLIKRATDARAAAIRTRAIWEMAGSSVVFVFCGGAIVMQMAGRFIVIGIGALLIWTFAVLSVAWFLRALWRLLIGRTSGPINWV